MQEGTDESVPPSPADPSLNLPDQVDLRAILDHARNLFQYHALQRLTTIRYFFVAFAAFAAAYATVIGDPTKPELLQLFLSVSALVVTLAFWALDVRNSGMVRVDEFAQKELEELVAKRYGLKYFEIAKAWEMDEAGFFRKRIFKYGFITFVLFMFLTINALIATIVSLRQFAIAQAFIDPLFAKLGVGK